MDIDLTNPEITLTVDRQRAMTEGINSSQIGQELRTALSSGLESSKIKVKARMNIRFISVTPKTTQERLTDLLNMNITFRDIASGWRNKECTHQLPCQDRLHQYARQRKEKEPETRHHPKVQCTQWIYADGRQSAAGQIHCRFQEETGRCKYYADGRRRTTGRDRCLPGESPRHCPGDDPDSPCSPI